MALSNVSPVVAVGCGKGLELNGYLIPINILVATQRLRRGRRPRRVVRCRVACGQGPNCARILLTAHPRRTHAPARVDSFAWAAGFLAKPAAGHLAGRPSPPRVIAWEAFLDAACLLLRGRPPCPFLCPPQVRRPSTTPSLLFFRPLASPLPTSSAPPTSSKPSPDPPRDAILPRRRVYPPAWRRDRSRALRGDSVAPPPAVATARAPAAASVVRSRH